MFAVFNVGKKVSIHKCKSVTTSPADKKLHCVSVQSKSNVVLSPVGQPTPEKNIWVLQVYIFDFLNQPLVQII